MFIILFLKKVFHPVVYKTKKIQTIGLRLIFTIFLFCSVETNCICEYTILYTLSVKFNIYYLHIYRTLLFITSMDIHVHGYLYPRSRFKNNRTMVPLYLFLFSSFFMRGYYLLKLLLLFFVYFERCITNKIKLLI
jgi:hypothetical protein